MVLKFNEDNWPVVYFYLGDEEINEEFSDKDSFDSFSES